MQGGNLGFLFSEIKTHLIAYGIFTHTALNTFANDGVELLIVETLRLFSRAGVMRSLISVIFFLK
eukprot:4084499-Ditylum_brightwellii.AAC.1